VKTGVLILGAFSLSAQETISLSLSEAFRRAPEANFDILIGTERLEAQRQQQRRAFGGLLPSVSAEAGQSRSQAFFNNQVGTATIITNRFDALLRARFSVFDVETHASYRVAKFNTEIAELTLEATVQDILLAIGQAYFGHLRNLRAKEVIEANIRRDETFLTLAKNRFEAGAATEIDVTRAQVSLSTNRLRLLEQETQIDESALALKQALNLAMGANLIVDPVDLPEIEPIAFTYPDLDLILERRPEVVSARRTLERNEVAKKAADWQRLPSIDLTGSYGRAGTTYENATEEAWSIGVGVSVPIFEGFRIDADQMEAASAVREQQTRVRQIETEVEGNYRLQLSRLATRVQQVEIAREQVALAERELELARVRFEEGVTDNSEVVDAQARLASANDGLVEAEYLFYLARLELARIRGDVRGVLTSVR
jgi:outer membrane protein TolC